MCIKAKKRYINQSTNRINENALKQDAVSLPLRHQNYKDFRNSFGSGNHYNTEFKGYKIHIDLSYAYRHFKNNTYSENREYLNSSLLETIKDPLIVIKDTYEGKKAITFYKPFISNSQVVHLAMHKAVENIETGVYTFKTIFTVTSLDKVFDIVNTLDLNTIYFKFN